MKSGNRFSSGYTFHPTTFNSPSGEGSNQGGHGPGNNQSSGSDNPEEIKDDEGEKNTFPNNTKEEELLVDTCPVCNMDVETTKFYSQYNGKTFFFCSDGCLQKFISNPGNFFGNHNFDLIIVGGGPAGLTAAVYASISKIDTFFIAKDIGGQAIDSTKIKNYMGFDFISGKMLVDKFKEQFLENHYLAHKLDDVIHIEKQNNSFKITTKSNETFLSKAVIIATGMKKRKLGIEGEERLQRKGIFYKLVQDISLLEGKDIVVIGGGNSSIQTANELLNNHCKVTIVTKGKMIADKTDVDRIKQRQNIRIIEEHDVMEIWGEEKVEGVSVRPEKDINRPPKSIPCDGVFIQVGFLPNTEFCKEVVDLNEKGEIVINNDCSTATEGVFACGDVTNNYGKRIVIASGEGAKAVLRTRQFLKEKKTTKIL
ncbi:MAG: FAD-dependent oxidoreductase [Bacteroidales bacterium]|nr:FAD-dependent oxidoreductase [Bacteroidales bacterium]